MRGHLAIGMIWMVVASLCLYGIFESYSSLTQKRVELEQAKTQHLETKEQIRETKREEKVNDHRSLIDKILGLHRK